MTNLKLTQNGRSMVEMLGVLAIIGVLSVAGIQGYTVAMNKHRANEILNEASKRAIVVASQIASGRTPTLTEFTDNEVGGAEFSTTVEKVDDNKFRIGYVSGKEPSEAVQKQMENIASTNGMIQGFNGGLTYNNDLTAGSGAEGGSESADSCPAGTSENGAGGYATTEGTGTDAIRCYCTESGSTYVEGSGCTGTTKTTACESFRDCNKGQYCRFSPDNCGDDDRGNGTCTTLSSLETKTNGTQTLYLGPQMDWWSAGDFCAAHGKTLVSYSTLSNAPYNCSKDSYRCTWSVFRGMGLNEYYWTGEDYGDSCAAWCVGVASGFSCNARSSDYPSSALCE